MSILTYTELCRLADRGIITDVPREHINAASIDCTLAPLIWREAPPDIPRTKTVVDLKNKESPDMLRYDMGTHGYFSLEPGQFCLASTRETFHLPANDPEFGAIAAEYRLKSSLARAGLNAALAMWCDPGWSGSVLTLELFNNLRYHTLHLRVGQKIGQIIFMKGTPVPDHASYATVGRYNHDRHATPSKGVR